MNIILIDEQNQTIFLKMAQQKMAPASDRFKIHMKKKHFEFEFENYRA